MTRSLRRLAAGALCAWALSPGLARAETTAAQRATAEALFQQATSLMEAKRFAEACEKFAGSQELDPALGTMLYLADCYERSGKTASAWALFREAAEKSKQAGQGERAQIAAERANSLEQQLSKLTLTVLPASRVPGLELSINGAPVPSASWNGPLPIDPGDTRVEAHAPGKKPWSTRLSVAKGPTTKTLDVPRLADAPRPRSAPSGKAEPAPVSSSQKTIGYVLGGAGIVALAVGGVLGYRAYSLDKTSKSGCREDEPNACTPDAVDQRNDAKTSAALSTIATVGGAGLTVTGLALIITAPKSETTPEAGPSTKQLSRLTLSLTGTW